MLLQNFSHFALEFAILLAQEKLPRSSEGSQHKIAEILRYAMFCLNCEIDMSVHRAIDNSMKNMYACLIPFCQIFISKFWTIFSLGSRIMVGQDWTFKAYHFIASLDSASSKSSPAFYEDIVLVF